MILLSEKLYYYGILHEQKLLFDFDKIAVKLNIFPHLLNLRGVFFAKIPAELPLEFKRIQPPRSAEREHYKFFFALVVFDNFAADDGNAVG